jgi:uncharacterized NAD(P)/FAD-binding protein YdhS
MVKQFDLNEAESDYLNDIAEAINKERTDLCEDIQMTLLYGSYSKSKRNAIRALLVYFGAKAQKENEVCGAFDCVIVGRIICHAATHSLGYRCQILLRKTRVFALVFYLCKKFFVHILTDLYP